MGRHYYEVNSKLIHWVYGIARTILRILVNYKKFFQLQTEKDLLSYSHYSFMKPSLMK